MVSVSDPSRSPLVPLPVNLCFAACSLMRGKGGGREGGKSWGKGIEREETAGERGGMGKETEGKKQQRKKT